MFWPFTRKSKSAPTITTARLELIPITPALLAADAESNAALARALRANIPAEWPPEHWEPHVLTFITQQLTDHPTTAGYHRYVLLPDPATSTRTLIGCTGGFPKPNDDVEIGYSTLPSYQRQGYGTEAVRTLVDWLLTRNGVQSVSAQTYPTLPESIKIMQRCGMHPAGSGDEPTTLRYRRTR